MKDALKTIWEWLKANYMTVILFIVVCVLVIIMCKSCSKAKAEKQISDHNITALTDSIEYYKARNGEEVAQKTLLIGDIETLELANKKLADELHNMRVKNADMAVYIKTLVDNPKRDTMWIVSNDTTFHETFNFDDMPYRQLSGRIDLKDKQLSMNVDTDKVYLDLNVALEENNVLIKSNNPYLSFEEIYGVTVPQYEPTWCLVVGPSVSAGYGCGTNFNGGNCPGGLVVSAGVSLTFGWNIVCIGKRIKKVK